MLDQVLFIGKHLHNLILLLAGKQLANWVFNLPACGLSSTSTLSYTRSCLLCCVHSAACMNVCTHLNINVLQCCIVYTMLAQAVRPLRYINVLQCNMVCTMLAQAVRPLCYINTLHCNLEYTLLALAARPLRYINILQCNIVYTLLAQAVILFVWLMYCFPHSIVHQVLAQAMSLLRLIMHFFQGKKLGVLTPCSGYETTGLR